MLQMKASLPSRTAALEETGARKDQGDVVQWPVCTWRSVWLNVWAEAKRVASLCTSLEIRHKKIKAADDGENVHGCKSRLGCKAIVFYIIKYFRWVLLKLNTAFLLFYFFLFHMNKDSNLISLPHFVYLYELTSPPNLCSQLKIFTFKFLIINVSGDVYLELTRVNRGF